jgi:creatinine amidohydrolase
MKFLLEDMTWPEIVERAKQTEIALVPVGATEEHGPHLPINNDNLVALEISKEIAKRTKKFKPVIAPLIPYGISDFPGFNKYPQLSLTPETFYNVCKEIAEGLVKLGFPKIIFIDGHGGNPGALSQVAGALSSGAIVTHIEWWMVAGDVINEVMESEGRFWGHAGEMETSVSWALGQVVDEAKMKDLRYIPKVQEELRDYLLPFMNPKIHVPIPAITHEDIFPRFFPGPDISPGVLGEVRYASIEKGNKILEKVYKICVDLVKNFAELDLS